MPRWAEILVIVGVAVVVAFAILVISRLRTQDTVQALSAPDPALVRARAIPSLPADLLDVSALPPPRPSGELEAALAEALPPGLEVAAASLSPTVGSQPGQPAAPQALPLRASPALALSDVTGPPPPPDGAASDAEAPSDVEEPNDAETVDATDAALAVVVSRDAVSAIEAPVPPGSHEELVLLRAAEEALARLHAVRLRGDVPRQTTLDEAKRLEAILSRLPEGRRQELNALLDRGYRRVGTVEVGPDGVAVVRGVGLGNTEADDRPGDLRGVSDSVRALERKLGVTPTAPVQTRPAATNPTYLPSVEASPTAPTPAVPTPAGTTRAAPSPAAAPSALPSATSTPL
jgi:hypothetical protein